MGNDNRPTLKHALGKRNLGGYASTVDNVLRGAPSRPEDHKDYTKISRLSTRLPVRHILIDGTLSPRAAATRTDFRLSSGEQAAYLVVTR